MKGLDTQVVFFHYIKNIRLNLNKIGLFKKNISNISQDLLKELGSIPFNVHNNNNIINEIFDKYSYKYSDKDDNIKYENFKSYFIKTWNKYFINGSLNYIYLNKKQRSNSYLENYNKRIKQILGLFLSEKGKTVIPWPLLLTFIKNEEHYYSGLIKHKIASILFMIQIIILQMLY